MKILIISQHIFPMQTPRAHRTTELIKELSNRGYLITVYAVLGKYDYRSFENKYNVYCYEKGSNIFKGKAVRHLGTFKKWDKDGYISWTKTI